MDRQKQLEEAAENMLPNATITMGLMEHQIDLIGKIVVSLCENIDLPESDRSRVETLKEILKYSSIDFTNINSPLQSYKIPAVLEGKQRTRLVQDQYLMAQMREGVF